MSQAFLNRLKNKQLTNVDQYRQMQSTRLENKTEDKKAAEDTEDWKNWQLVPVSGDSELVDDPALLDPRSEGARGLSRAMKVLNQK